MTRLGNYGGVYPIGSSVGSANVAGTTWELYDGWNGDMHVYSFIAPGMINSFSADIKDFYNHLVNSHGFPAGSQYLISKLSRPLKHEIANRHLRRCSQPIRHRALHWRSGHFYRVLLVCRRELEQRLWD